MQVRKCQRQNDEIVTGGQFSLRRGQPDVEGCSEGKSAEMLTLFEYEFIQRMLQEILGYDPKLIDGSLVNGTVILIARL